MRVRLTSYSGNGRERLAWGVLLGSFAIWLALLIAVPVLVLRYVEGARRPLVLAVQAAEGTVGLADLRGRRPAILAGEPAQKVEGEASILTNTTDSALIQVYTPEETEVLARMVLYGATSMDVRIAEAPRFSWSDADYRITLDLKGGRLRLTVPPREGRSLDLEVLTPQGGTVTLDEVGQYIVDAGNVETWVAVQEGMALASGGGESLMLRDSQAARLRQEAAPEGPVSSDRNLIRNGDFNDGLSGWNAAAWTIQRSDQSSGATSVVNIGGEKVLRFHRVGEGAANTLVRQTINQDVTDVSALRALVTLKIESQSLEVCGAVGSECPLFVAITYEDVYGAERTWQQGFYAFGQPREDYTPDFCTSCGPPVTTHVSVPQHELHSWESDNLIEKLSQENMSPRRIKSISLLAQGHTFESQVFDVALIAEE